MKRFLWLATIVGSVLTGLMLMSGVLASDGAPQPSNAPAAGAPADCLCKDLPALTAELRNAMKLKQAFANKIADLRTMNGDSAQVALKVFAQGDARRNLETIPNYNGPSEVDYSPWGENQRTFNFPNDQLCRMSDSAKANLEQAVAASACAGIGKALRAHEDVHGNMCRSIGYKAYLGMHGADRAQEEVEAYEAQIKVLTEIIAGLSCAYRASGNFGPNSFSGTICDLEKPFTVQTSNQLMPEIKFDPTSSTTGAWSYSYRLVSGGGSGDYTIEGPDSQRTGIVMKGSGTATYGPISGTGGGTVRIILTPLKPDEKCK